MPQDSQIPQPPVSPAPEPGDSPTFPFCPSPVKVDRGMEALECPCCGFDYLRHRRVVVYDQGEDKEYGCTTTIEADTSGNSRINQTSSMAGNPSLRRGAITIEFDCEGCAGWDDRPIRLALEQHKGQTLVRWV